MASEFRPGYRAWSRPAENPWRFVNSPGFPWCQARAIHTGSRRITRSCLARKRRQPKRYRQIGGFFGFAGADEVEADVPTNPVADDSPVPEEKNGSLAPTPLPSDVSEPPGTPGPARRLRLAVPVTS